MRYEILDDAGEVINTIVADEDFVQANFQNYRYAPVADQTVLPADPCASLIDIGPFFDRFGAAKMPVMINQDAAVQAIIRDAQSRKWINLTLPEVAASLAYIASKEPALTQEIRDAVLSLPVRPDENMALRKLYFS